MRPKLQDDRRYRLRSAYRPNIGIAPDHESLWMALRAPLDKLGERGVYGSEINAICRAHRNPAFGHYLYGQLLHLEIAAPKPDLPPTVRVGASEPSPPVKSGEGPGAVRLHSFHRPDGTTYER